MAIKTLYGVKREMSQIFEEDGTVVPVTILSVDPAVVTQLKTVETDGYGAVQIGFGEVKRSRVNKPTAGHFRKAEVEPKSRLREVRLDKPEEYKVGDVVKASDVFKKGDWIDVIGNSKGKGYQGGIKRHGFNSGPRAHGTKNAREMGSVGPGTSIGRVFPGTRMPGHMGAARVTVRNLVVARVDDERNLVYVRGAVPGHNGSLIQVRSAKAKRLPKADRALRKG